MHFWTSVFFAVVLASGAAAHPLGGVDLWARTALNRIRAECGGCEIKQSDVLVYTARPSIYGQYRARVADGSGRLSGRHDCILVLDPTPDKRFGHELHPFFIDRNLTEEACIKALGSYLENGDCIQEWTREMCVYNVPKHRRVGCKLQFLPEARLGASSRDSLECDKYVSGFSTACPVMAKHNLEFGRCASPETNSHKCELFTQIHTGCTPSTICNQAMIISGGWNKRMSDKQMLSDITGMTKVLESNGFRKKIRIFFANGLHPEEDKKELPFVYPGSMKEMIRKQIKTLCSTEHCTDTFVIYLNGPSYPDGTIMLWDVNNNGVLDPIEIYTVVEFFRDIMNCKARRLVILADQSYSAEIVRRAHNLPGLSKNVVILGVEANDTRGSMVKMFSKAKPTPCLSDLYNSSVVKFKGNTPGLLNSLLLGLPCTAAVDHNYDSYPTCHDFTSDDYDNLQEIAEPPSDRL